MRRWIVGLLLLLGVIGAGSYARAVGSDHAFTLSAVD